LQVSNQRPRQDGWDGDIGSCRKNYNFLSGNSNGLIGESTNYFKGTGINIKLKDLLQGLLKEQGTSCRGSPQFCGGYPQIILEKEQ
jgi:hypothetical protein